MYGLGLGLGLGLTNYKSQIIVPEGTILGGLYSDADSFFAATVSPGAVAITGALFSDADIFHAATVARGTVQITGALFSDADTFFGATVSAGGGGGTAGQSIGLFPLILTKAA
jgi:hypothetical protein